MANEGLVWAKDFQRVYDEGGLILGHKVFVGDHYIAYTKDKSLQRVIEICVQAHRRIDNLELMESTKVQAIKKFSLLDFWRWKTGRKSLNQF